ncbi:hypothetical protein SAMN02745146_1280 [Hymenobacter daecheongensis DSM 21074]|uniref:Outer membrane protein beta-barrel domain-containing protein n=1 Tax=Hymenobacter daecheongensis DSM 21074 TaxID=1121955 RepID=A0A1M6CUQ2_9BACT|nr:hypothetical protein [Hymenobacter daecheongensis]SHI64815.1 hypothetical protein SAMN02745146_1280 [Hymenobacter daecheongensis DSM 21074]
MKNTTLPVILLVLLGSAAHAQDTPHLFEVGLDVVNHSPFVSSQNSFYNTYSNDKTQWLSGVLFRYNLNRFALRTSINYTTNTQAVDSENCADCLVGESKGQEAKLKVGGQYAPFARAPWLYVFSDVYYRRYASEGNLTGGLCGCLDTDVRVKSNGFGIAPGLGAKVRMLNHFYLNPEVYHEVGRGTNTETYADRRTGEPYPNSLRTPTYLRNLSVRLNAIYAF